MDPLSGEPGPVLDLAPDHRATTLDDDLMGRPVAMKLLHPHLAGTEKTPTTAPARERFLEEAQVTAHLSHPSIVVVHELGTRPSGELY